MTRHMHAHIRPLFGFLIFSLFALDFLFIAELRSFEVLNEPTTFWWTTKLLRTSWHPVYSSGMIFFALPILHDWETFKKSVFNAAEVLGDF